MVKTYVWAAGIASAALILILICFRLASAHQPGQLVQIVQNGTVVREIDLSRVKEEYSFTLSSDDGGSNTILVQPGRICVSEADCPDQICVMQGWLSDQVIPIACLPHRLIIMLKGPTGNTAEPSDAVAR